MIGSLRKIYDGFKNQAMSNAIKMKIPFGKNTFYLIKEINILSTFLDSPNIFITKFVLNIKVQ